MFRVLLSSFDWYTSIYTILIAAQIITNVESQSKTNGGPGHPVTVVAVPPKKCPFSSRQPVVVLAVNCTGKPKPLCPENCECPCPNYESTTVKGIPLSAFLKNPCTDCPRLQCCCLDCKSYGKPPPPAPGKSTDKCICYCGDNQKAKNGTLSPANRYGKRPSCICPPCTNTKPNDTYTCPTPNPPTPSPPNCTTQCNCPCGSRTTTVAAKPVQSDIVATDPCPDVICSCPACIVAAGDESSASSESSEPSEPTGNSSNKCSCYCPNSSTPKYGAVQSSNSGNGTICHCPICLDPPPPKYGY